MAFSAPRDENNVPTIFGILGTDGVTPMPICVDPVTHGLCVIQVTSPIGTAVPGHTAVHDDNESNKATSLIGVSSSDLSTVTQVYVNASHEVLIKS